MKPKIEEFMIFEDFDGRTGVIIRNDSEKFPWWKCFKGDNLGTIFNDQEGNKEYNNIRKLFKCIRASEYFHFCALKFMQGIDEIRFNEYYNCVYSATKKDEDDKLLKAKVKIVYKKAFKNESHEVILC